MSKAATLNTDKAPKRPADKLAKPTPMMAQFMTIKEQAGDEVLLFYRMGDFYELFFDDAVRAAAALDIALTKRGKHQGQDIPMCGVPVHAAETYLQRLIKKGFRVAVCEQTESPAEAKKRGSKSVVRREIVRLVTPGTLTEDSLLDARGANFIAALALTAGRNLAISWADISDGQFWVMSAPLSELGTALAAISPRELVVPQTAFSDAELRPVLTSLGAELTPQPAAKFDMRAGERRLKARFETATLDGFGAFERAELAAAGALLDYIELTQAGAKAQISAPRRVKASGFMAIDPATRASLEIDKAQTSGARAGGRKGSLLGAIDKTVSGPGARLLAERLRRPLISLPAITARLDGVSFFHAARDLRSDIVSFIKGAGDPARSLSRLALGRGGPRDLLMICNALYIGEQICARFGKEGLQSPPSNIKTALSNMSLAAQPELASFAQKARRALNEDVPILARDGGFVREGYHAALDNFLTLRKDSRKIIARLQGEYAQQTNIPTLKIKHNNVLGYFIEVTARYGDQLLGDEFKAQFIHRQTLVSGVRFTTTELAELDAQIASAGDKAVAIEIEIFEDLRAQISAQSDKLRAAAQALAAMDVSCALASWAEHSGAVRPIIDESEIFDIKAGRHPVVEAALKADGQSGFTPNDCALDARGEAAHRLTLITGPNMAGKSTYLRQNALMFILAQAGSFVPAAKAHIGICHQLFSRVGASDDLSKGRSTFMVEMIETAAILNQSGPKSFVILDEIGRGTSTFDGLSIAWATAEHLHEVNGGRALFATHYHELTELIDALPYAGNASLRAKEWEGDLVFLHDVQSGAADKSYGIQVARLAGLPQAATQRAREVLSRLESEQSGRGHVINDLPLFSAALPQSAPAAPSEIEQLIADLNIDDLSARAALDLLYELKAKSRKNTDS